MEFVEHPGFTRQIQQLNAEDQLRRLQNDLAANPEAGDVIPGMGGLRKIRMPIPGRGKRGGARVLHLVFLRASRIYMVQAYTKGDMADLPPDVKKQVKRLVEQIKSEFEDEKSNGD